nr:transposase [Escherichia coli]
MDDVAIQAQYDLIAPSSRGRPQHDSGLAIIIVLAIKGLFRLTLQLRMVLLILFALMGVPELHQRQQAGQVG